jgi:hypothetical protein
LHGIFISAKRYVLFNVVDGRPVIRKASAHGLGHLRPSYEEKDAPKSVPAPAIPLTKIGVDRWHYDLWYMIIMAVLEGHPDEVNMDYHPALNKPAISRYSAANPELLGWFRGYNRDRAYRDQVKPFGFLMGLQAADAYQTGSKDALRPESPFYTDLKRAVADAFDRKTGTPVTLPQLKTYTDALRGYHLSPEMKFGNGDHFDRGRTERRHVQITSVEHIGKEANEWERQAHLGLDFNAVIEYGGTSTTELEAALRAAVRRYGERATARSLDVSRMSLRKALASGFDSLRYATRSKLSRVSLT